MNSVIRSLISVHIIFVTGSSVVKKKSLIVIVPTLDKFKILLQSLNFQTILICNVILLLSFYFICCSNNTNTSLSTLPCTGLLQPQLVFCPKYKYHNAIVCIINMLIVNHKKYNYYW